MQRLRIILVALAVLSVSLVATAAPVAADEPASDPATQQFEIRFMKKTIEHHLMGVMMGEMCVEKATPPPPSEDATLVTLCQQIIEAQTEEAAMLQTWLADWYGITYEPNLTGGGMNRLARATGEEFDIMVSDMFIDHHLRQIRMSDDCLVRAEHEELQDLCAEMIAAQASEITQFEDILEAHGVAR